MHHTIYKTTNNINGKYYIGKHKTQDLDDNYLGSGKILKRAIKKHGIDNFTKEYLFIFDNEEDMNNKENEIVSIEFIKEDTNYNLKIGGEGGWDYINTKYPNGTMYGKSLTVETKKILSDIMIERYNTDKEYYHTIKLQLKEARRLLDIKYPEGIWKGKKHTKETRVQMSKSNTHQKGSNNSQYGMMWIYSLEEKISKRIKKDEIIPDGWYKGRKIKF